MKYFLVLLLIPMSSFASTTQYCLEGKVVNLSSNSQTGSMVCNVSQKLTWEDSSALFECNFGDYKDQLFSPSVRIGTDMGSTAWSYYDFTPNALGQFLAKGLNLNGIKRSQSIKILYTEKVWAQDTYVVIEDQSGINKLFLKAHLGRCN